MFRFFVLYSVFFGSSSIAEDIGHCGNSCELRNIPVNVWQAKQDSSGKPIGLRMEYITRPLLQTPYLLDGIGEEQYPDTDPIVRYDAFDCLSFIEEAIALSLGDTEEEVDFVRKELRYGNGDISYTNRNHFMESQWIPNAIAKGYLVDITHNVGETHIVSKTLTQHNWERWKSRPKFALDIGQFPVGTTKFGVLSLDVAIQSISTFPEGALLVIVRQNNPYNPVWITHLGFVVRSETNPKDVKIRHATKMSSGGVKEHNLLWYFEHIRLYSGPMEGILVLMPQEKDILLPSIPK